MPFTRGTEIKLYYESAGDGEPVLFISGTGSDLRVKPNVLDGPLAKSRMVLTYDQRGLGQTAKPEGPYTMADYADDAADLLDELGFDAIDVIGVSFGGMVAQHFALRHPERVKKLVLCCTSPGGEFASYPLHELIGTDEDEKFQHLLPVNDTRRDEEWQAANPDKIEKMKQMTADSRPEDHDSAAHIRGSELQLLARKDHDVSGELKSLHAPTLICAGKYDGMARQSNQEALLAGIPNSELQWFEGGHLFLIQDKAAWPAIIKFLG